MKTILTALLILLTFATVHAAEVTLAWDAPTNPAWGTRIFIGTTAGTYTASHDAGAGVVQTKVSGLEPGKTYFFAARHYYAGAESGLSNEVNFNPPSEITILPDLEPWAGEEVKTYQITIKRVGE